MISNFIKKCKLYKVSFPNELIKKEAPEHHASCRSASTLARRRCWGCRGRAGWATGLLRRDVGGGVLRHAFHRDHLPEGVAVVGDHLDREALANLVRRVDVPVLGADHHGDREGVVHPHLEPSIVGQVPGAVGQEDREFVLIVTGPGVEVELEPCERPVVALGAVGLEREVRRVVHGRARVLRRLGHVVAGPRGGDHDVVAVDRGVADATDQEQKHETSAGESGAQKRC